MSIQDPTPDPRQSPYGQQPYGAGPATPGYGPVADASAQSQESGVPPPDAFGGYPGPVYPAAPLPGAPNPGLAALLGFIPGVGAMYNGQFPKGIAHIAIFAVFSSLSKNVNGIFGLFVAGWVFYMVFEAYQTARARRDGLPLPDPFGLNNIGERFGFRGSPDFSSFWSHGAPPPPFAGASQSDASAGPHYYRGVDPAAAQAPYQVDPAGNVFRPAAAGPGYVPPPAGAYASYGPPPSAPYAAPYGAGYTAPPFPVPPIPPMPPMPAVTRNGLPTGAIWLIALGFFALLGSMRSFAFLEGEATGGLFLIGLAIFLFWRRYSVSRTMYPAGTPGARWSLLHASKGAGTVFVIGLLTLLQGLHVVRWEYSWPFLLIFLGVFILLERLALNGMNANTYPSAYPGGPAATVAEPEAVVETSSPTSIVPKYTRPSNDLNDTEGR